MGLKEQVRIFHSEKKRVEDRVEREQAEEESDGFGDFKHHAVIPLARVVYLFASAFSSVLRVCDSLETLLCDERLCSGQ